MRLTLLMHTALHVLVFLLGVFLLFAIIRSMIRVALMNRHEEDMLAHRTTQLVYRVMAVFIERRRDYAVTQRILIWFFPIYILALIALYFVGALVGFALMYWAADSVSSWQQAFIASGSALNTLGFFTPKNLPGQWLAIPEGALGLGIVVFLFTFLPGYQSVILSRELMTAWLYARTGDPPSGLALLEWCKDTGIEDMRHIWWEWEQWFRTLSDTHSVSPMLALVPSVQSGQSWIMAGIAVLDSSALMVSSMEGTPAKGARICLHAGSWALRNVAEVTGHISHRTVTAVAVLREDYEVACSRLAAAGYPMKADREASWREFLELRRQYQDSCAYMGHHVFAPVPERLVPARDLPPGSPSL